MAASIQINQVGLADGVAGVAREDGLDDGSLVTLVSLAHESSFDFALLWTGQHPNPDTTSVASLQAAGPNAVSFSPTAGVYGTWRIELVTDRGTSKEDRAEIAFAIKTSPTAIRIPAANERSDPSASLVNNGASYVARSTFNAPDGISGSPFELGTYVSWWRALADLIHAGNAGGAQSLVGVIAGGADGGGYHNDAIVVADSPVFTSVILNAPGLYLTGIVAPVGRKQVLTVINNYSTVHLMHQSGLSAANNRFSNVKTSADVVLAYGDIVTMYHSGSGNWQVYA